MRLSEWLSQNQITTAAFTRMIGSVTHEAVKLWAAGRRMPGTKHVLAIEKITEGRVTVVDLHKARVEQMKGGKK